MNDLFDHASRQEDPTSGVAPYTDDVTSSVSLTSAVPMYTSTGLRLLTELATDVFGHGFNTSSSLATANVNRWSSSLQTHEYIVLICTPIIVIFGTVGNGLSALVLTRPRYRSSSTSVYLLALAVCDTIFLYVNSMTKYFFKLLLNTNYSTLYEHSCATYVYVLYVSKCLSTWLVVAVTVERLYAITHPMNAKAVVTRRRAAIVACSVSAAVLAIYSFVLFSYSSQLEDDVDANGHGVDGSSGALSSNGSARQKIGCDMRPEYRQAHVDVVLKVLDLIAYSLIPSIILFSCNTLLTYNVLRSSNFRRHSVRGVMAAKRASHQSRRLTLTLLLLSCAYLVLTFPMAVFLCYTAVVQEVRHYEVVFRSLYTLQLSNSALNFVLYTSGPAFRAELRRIFCCCCKSQGYLAERSRWESSLAPAPVSPCGRNDTSSPTCALSVC